MSGADDARMLLYAAMDSTEGEYFSKSYQTVSEKESTRVSLITAIKQAISNEYYKQAASLIDFGSIKEGGRYVIRIRKLSAPEYSDIVVTKKDGTAEIQKKLILSYGMVAQMQWLAKNLLDDNKQHVETFGTPQYTDQAMKELLNDRLEAYATLEYYQSPKREETIEERIERLEREGTTK